MTDARSRTPEGYVRGTVGRWVRDRRLLVAVIGALAILAVGAISAAALVGLPTISTSDTNAGTNAGASQATPTVNDVAPGTLEGATLSVAAATLIDHVCAKKTSGKLFYLATCKRSQTLVPVTSTSPQFKACYVKATRITRKVSNSTTCRAAENTIPKVPADTTSLYFCVDSDGVMYFKGTTEPTCGARKFAVVIGPHNQPPEAAGDGPYSVAEDASLEVTASEGVLANDSDPDGDPITAELVDDVANGTLTLDAADGSFTYEPNDDFYGTDSFTYKAKDTNNGLSDEVTVTITVTPVDDAPVAVDDSASVDEGGTIVAGDVLANDVDVDGDTLNAVIVSGPINASSFNLNADGSFNYVHNGGETTSDSFTYKANDGALDSNVATVTISVDPVNDAPVAVDDSASVGEGGTLTFGAPGVLANDTDAENDALDAVLVSGPSNASSFNLNADGSYTYTHDGSESTSDSFTYKANDGTADSNVATVNITVVPANDAPVAVEDGYEVDEEGLLVADGQGGNPGGVLDNDTDAENDALQAVLTDDVDHGTLALDADGTFTYEPSGDFDGTDSFQYKANDGTADSNVVTVTITVNPVNDAPVNTLPTGPLTAVQDTDKPIGGISVADVDAGSGFVEVTLGVTDGTLTLKTDVSGGLGAADVSGNGTGSVTATGTLEQINATLADADGLVYHGDATFTGTDTLTVTTDDQGNTGSGGAKTDTDTLSINVEPPNSPPTALEQNVDADEEVAETITLAADDPDGDAVTEFAISDQPDNGSLGPIGSISCDGQTPNHCTADVTYTGNKDYNGPDEFQFTASDAQATGQPATVSITVNAVDDPPVAADDSATVDEDSDANAIDVLTNDDDVDGGTKTIDSVTQPTNGTVVITGGGTGLTYAPNANYCNDPPGTSPDTFTYTLSPGGSTATVSLTVTCVDDDPVATDDSATVDEDSGASAIDVLANDDDVDGGTKTIDSVTQPTNGTVVITGGGTGLTYQPKANYCNEPPGTNPDTFTYTLSPGGSTATVSIKVTCVDDAPVAVNDSATVLEDAAASPIDVLTNDTDIDAGPKTISSASDPANGTVVLTGGSPGAHTGLTYKPDPNYCNDPPATNLDTFTYTLNGNSQGTVSVKVTCVNDAPTAGNETFNGAIHNTSFVVDDPSDAAPNVGGAKKAISGDVLSNDSDVETPGSVSVVANANITSTNGGKVAIEADGDFTYLSDPNDNCSPNSDSFTYTVTDNDPGGAQTGQGTVTINLSGCVWYVDNDPATAGNAGTSTDPFDALSSAEAKSVANQTVFVHKGTSNYAGGFNLDANERLIGEAVNLVVGSDTLFTGAPANRPSLSGTVNLNSGNTISGVAIAGSGAPAISGASGDASGTIADVSLTGNAGGLKITGGASGTWNVSDLTVNTSGGDGIDVEDAGTLNLQSAGTISLSAAAGRGLVLADNPGTTGTMALSGTVDSTTVTSSPTTGIFMRGTTGSLTLDDVNLTTTGTGLDIDSSNNVTVNNSGDADITSSGSAVSLTTVTSNPADMPVVALDQVSSTGGTTGINIDDIGAGTFSANGGTLSNHSGAEVDVNNGTGNITYPGTIGNGSGLSAQITGRSGGTVTLAGNINDTNDLGGGIDMSGNTGGSTTFSGATKTLNTGASAAFSSTGSGHTINFTNGGLDIDTTSGAGFSATGGGTIVVGTGANPNTIDSTTGTALNVSNTTIGGSGLTFRSISSNGGSNNGIILDTTGSNGGLTVTGDGTNISVGGNSSGGTIANKSGADGSATQGTGVYLNNTSNVILRRMTINGTNQNFGIRGNSVNGFTLEYSTVSGANGTSQALDEGSVNFDNLTGAAAITSSIIEGGLEDNLNVVNTSGTLNRLTISSSTFGFNNTANGNNNILIESQNSGTVLNFTLKSSLIKGARADWLNASNNSSSTMDAVIGGPNASDGNTFDNLGANAHPGAAAGGNRVVFGSVGALTADVRNNTLRGSKGEAIRVRSTASVATSTTGTANARVRNNVIGVQGTANSGSSEGSGIFVFGDGGSDMNVAVTDNTVYQYNNHGIRMDFGDEIFDGSVFNATVTGNTVSNPGTINSDFNAIHLNNGSVGATDNFTTCVDIGGATASLRNIIAGGGQGTVPPNNNDLRLRQRMSTTVRLPGYAGANNDNAAVQTYLSGRNTLTTVNASNTVPAGGGGYVNTPGGAACTLPTVP